MGYDFCNAWRTKDDVVREYTRERNSYRFVKHSLRGNVLWGIAEKKDTGERFITCTLLQWDRRDRCYGIKEMDESCHPYYYDCPLGYLALCPEVNAEWRKNVRASHEQRRQASGLKVVSEQTP